MIIMCKSRLPDGSSLPFDIIPYSVNQQGPLEHGKQRLHGPGIWRLRHLRLACQHHGHFEQRLETADRD